MRVLYTPEPMTMIENIYKLPPKSILTLKGTDLVVEEYKIYTAKEKALSYNETKSILREKVIGAVGRQQATLANDDWRVLLDVKQEDLGSPTLVTAQIALKDAVNEALRYFLANVKTTYYLVV